MEKKNLAEVVQMDAKVTFDDLVNIYVSQYEEQLHQKRARIQVQIKELNAAKTELIKVIRAQVLEDAQLSFDNSIIGGFKVKFTVVVDDDHDLGKDTFWPITVKQFTEITIPDDLKWRSSSVLRDDVSQSVQWILKHRVEDGMVEAWNKTVKELGELKEQLLGVNGDIQSIDRKTRQIKGLLATKKLEDIGASNLLEMPEVQNILKLTQG